MPVKELRDFYEGPLYDEGNSIGEILEAHGYEFFSAGGPDKGEFVITLFKNGCKIEVKVTHAPR
jgi:hypothetical protein